MGRPYRDKGWFKNQWYSDKTIGEIASEANCSNRTIEIWSQKHGFPKRDEIKAYSSKAELERLYFGEKMSQSDIARHYDVSPATVSRWFEKEGIEKRSRSMSYAIRGYGKGLNTRKDGYEYFTVTYKGERSRCLHHRLLAVAKYGIAPVKNKDVHHKNGVRWDNRYENIQLLGKKEHGEIHGVDGGRPPE